MAEAMPEYKWEGKPEHHVFRNMETVRIIAFFICMGVFLGGLILGSTSNLTTADASLIVNQVQNQFEQFKSAVQLALRIAENNVEICLIFFIPVFGTFFMATVGYNTGIVFSASAIISHSATSLQLLGFTALLPFFWLEVIAYSLAASEGILFLFGVLTRRFKEESKNLLKTILVCVALLVVGAIVESILIQV